MLKREFLLMQKQDLVTKKDETLNELLLCFEEALKDYPDNTDIDSTLTVEDCYKKMEKFARDNQRSGKYVFTSKHTKEFIVSYLKLDKKSSSFVNLEDFI